MKKWISIIILPFLSFIKNEEPSEWIHINQLGYIPDGIKVAVWCIKEQKEIVTLFNLVDVGTQKSVFNGIAGEPFGAYGPFKQTYRLNFSSFKKPGRYYLQT